MAVEQGPMSGFRDMLGEQMIPRQAMISTIQGVYEGYGFVPLKTPALERYETMTGKYGEEGEKLMYHFDDLGGRHVAMRYDQTVPLARVVTQHGGNLPTPYKRYAVGEVWRGDSPQAGRYREFTQFDADTVGTSSPMADAEIVAMMSDSMEALGAEAVIRVNNRRILDGLVELAGAQDEKDALRMIGTIDKVEKIGIDGVFESIKDSHGVQSANVVARYLGITGAPLERLQKVNSFLTGLGGSEAVEEGTENLNQVFSMLDAADYAGSRVVFDQTIARGLDYYTGIVYETTLTGAPKLGSVCSGGRFDNLVAAMGGPDMPAVGTSIGVDRLYDGLQQLGLLKEAKTSTEVMITNHDQRQIPAYMRIATLLRHAGIASEVHYQSVDPERNPGKQLGKQLRFADRLGIPYVVLAGPEELKYGAVKIKTLASGEQIEVPIAELANTIRALRSNTLDSQK